MNELFLMHSPKKANKFNENKESENNKNEFSIKKYSLNINKSNKKPKNPSTQIPSKNKNLFLSYSNFHRLHNNSKNKKITPKNLLNSSSFFNIYTENSKPNSKKLSLSKQSKETLKLNSFHPLTTQNKSSISTSNNKKDSKPKITRSKKKSYSEEKFEKCIFQYSSLNSKKKQKSEDEEKLSYNIKNIYKFNFFHYFNENNLSQNSIFKEEKKHNYSNFPYILEKNYLELIDKIETKKLNEDELIYDYNIIQNELLFQKNELLKFKQGFFMNNVDEDNSKYMFTSNLNEENLNEKEINIFNIELEKSKN